MDLELVSLERVAEAIADVQISREVLLRRVSYAELERSVDAGAAALFGW